MIHLALNITNPWSRLTYNSLKFGWNSSTPWKHKFLELDLRRSKTIIAVSFVVSHRCSHAGFEILLGLFGYDLMFALYDYRHWDYTTNDWEKPDDKENIL